MRYLPSTKKKSKIILSQLPFRFYNLDLTKQRSNIPLAAGLLKATASQEGLLKNTDIEILDPLTADVTSDSMLIDLLVNKRPAMIGFSLYLWNVLRTLYIIKEIKKHLPKTIIVVGGPEVTPEFNYLSSHGYIDFSIYGEGEAPFVQLVKHFLYGKPSLQSISNLIFRDTDKIICNPHLDVIDDINAIPSPYLSGCLNPRLYKRYWMETMRWCPHRCNYCLYHSRSKKKNPFYSLKRIEEELNYAKKMRVGHIDIHDSAFNLNPRFKEICKAIYNINKDKSFSINLFLHAESLKEEDVELLSKLNISSVEIGLQSINPNTLIKIDRKVDLGQWLKGVNLLRKKGLSIMVDIMIGLPEDNLQSILKTVEFLKKNKLDTCSIPPTLSVGPALTMRKELKELGIHRFQSQAPYFILETKKMPFADIRKAKISTTFHLRRKLPKNNLFSPFQDAYLPFLHTYCWAKYPYQLGERLIKEKWHPQDIPITKVVIDLNCHSDINYFKNLGIRLANKIANNLIVWFKIASIPNNHIKKVTELLKYLSKKNPYNIWNIVFEGCPPLSTQEERYIKQSVFYRPTNLDYREVYLKRALGKKEFYRVSTKLFYILPPPLNYPQEITPDVTENRKIFRSLYISTSVNLPNTIQRFCVRKNEGILVDFDREINAQAIIETLRLLEDKKDNHTSIRFRNLVLQRIWDKYFNRYTECSISNDHLILHMDADKKERSLYFSNERIMLDTTEFILSLKKSLPFK